MSLTSALNIAQSALRSTSRQTSVVSQNVAGARDPDYARRIAVVTSTAPGSRVIQIQRAANEMLFRQNLAAISSRDGQAALFAGMERLQLNVHGIDNASSASTALAELQKALDIYAATPSNRSLAENAVNAARQVVRSLNTGTEAIQTFRVETDIEIADGVSKLNELLASFEGANRAVIQGTRQGKDVSEALDQRDSILKQISEYVPVSTFTRGDNDMVIMAGNGATLFETVPRKISFESSPAYTPGMAGNAIYVDGVPLVGGSGGNTTASGKLAGLVQLRDGVAATMQSQLDEVARGLVAAFAESDQSTPATLPDMPGLFTWPGAPGMPAVGTLIDGLAATISVNPAFDSTIGGNPELLRDGGAGGAAYRANTTPGSASFTDLLIKYGDRLETPMPFDPVAENGDSLGLLSYATGSIGWFEGMRQDASRAAEAKDALAVRTQEALSNETGVNVDNEMALLLDLENAYEASARLIKAVDDMLVALMAAVN